MSSTQAIWVSFSTILLTCENMNNYVKAKSYRVKGRRMRGFSYDCSLPVTWQRWQSHHLIRRSRKPYATHRKPHGSIRYRIGLMGIFDLFGSWDLDLNPMTLIYQLNRNPYRRTGRAIMNVLRHGFQKLSSDRHDRNYMPHRFAGGQ